MTEPTNLSVNNSLARLMTRLRSDSIGAIWARGTGGALTIDVLGQGLLFGVQILLARVMGEDHYGVYVYVLAWLNILVLAAKLGLDTALLRYVAAYRARKEWGFLRGVLRSSNRLALMASIAVSSLAALVVWALQTQLGPELTYTFWIGCAALPLLALSGLRQAALRSLKYIVLAKLPESILRRVFLALLVGIVFILSSQSVNGPAAMGLDFLAITASFLIGTYWLQQRLPEPVNDSVPGYQNREWVTTALPLFLVSGTFMLSKRTDILMIGAFLDTTEAGIYNAASRVAELTLFGLTAASAIAAPMISELFAQGRRQELQRLVTLMARGALAFSIPIILVILIGGRWVLALFGPSFAGGYLALVILTAGQLANALTGPVGVLMSMTGHQNQLVLILTVSLLINVVMNYFLILALGVVGAALTTALVNAGWNIAATLFVYRRLHINCFALATIGR